MMWDRYDNGPGMMDGAGGALMWLLMLVVVLAAVAGIVALVLVLRRPATGPRDAAAAAAADAARDTDRADRVLDERFARGEIDEDEYLHRRTVLRRR